MMIRYHVTLGSPKRHCDDDRASRSHFRVGLKWICLSNVRNSGAQLLRERVAKRYSRDAPIFELKTFRQIHDGGLAYNGHKDCVLASVGDFHNRLDFVTVWIAGVGHNLRRQVCVELNGSGFQLHVLSTGSSLHGGDGELRGKNMSQIHAGNCTRSLA